MGLSSVCCILLLCSMVSLYHTSMAICDEGDYCPVHMDCGNNATYCEEGTCPAGDTRLIADLTAQRCDEAPITLEFTMATFSVSEGNGPSEPVLRLSRPLDCCTISVRVDIQDDDAIGGEDFERLRGDYGVAIFPAGKTTASFNVIIIDDELFEESETFHVIINEISVPYGVVLGSRSRSVVTILDNDPPTLKFEPTEYSVGEGNGVVIVSMSLSNPASFDIAFKVNNINDTATGCDYGLGPYDVVFPNKTTIANFSVSITDDNVIEPDEKFKLAIDKGSVPMPTQIVVNGDNTADVTVVDNEERVFVTFEELSYIVREDEEIIAPALVLDKPLDCCINIRAKLENSSALGRNVDFGPSMTYNYVFLANETKAYPKPNISIHDDLINEDKEDFNITIIDVSLPYGVEKKDGIGTARICIEDNDNGIEFAERELSVEEDTDKGFVSLTLVLTKPLTMNLTVQLITTSHSATENGDYEGGPFSVTIPKGESSHTFDIVINDDMLEESDETFTVTLTSIGLPEGVSHKINETATITILNDDYSCRFDESMYIINEGDSLTLLLSLTAVVYNNVTVNMQYTDENGTTRGTNDDYSYSTPRPVFLARTRNESAITITTIMDSIFEDDETFTVVANLPSSRGSCRADFKIVDDNECKFSDVRYEVNEGGEVQLSLNVTKPLPDDVNIKLECKKSPHLSLDHDLRMRPPKSVILVAGKTGVSILIGIKNDNKLENNETLVISAFPPSDNGHKCETNVIIVDDNYLRFSQPEYTINEGGRKYLTLTLDKALSTRMHVEIKYQYRGLNSPIRHRIAFEPGQTQFDNVELRVTDDAVLEHDEQFNVIATPPAEPKGSRDAIATVTINDNDALIIEFDYRFDTINIHDKNQATGPKLMLSGTAAFNMSFSLMQLNGTAKGIMRDSEPTDDDIYDFEFTELDITVLAGKTNNENGWLIDIIDDDIVEPQLKYYFIKINESSLPDGVSVGRRNILTINIYDDDVSTISMNSRGIRFSKKLYIAIRLTFTLNSNERPTPDDVDLPAKTDIAPYPPGTTRDDIRRVYIYINESLVGRVKEDYREIMIVWEP